MTTTPDALSVLLTRAERGVLSTTEATALRQHVEQLEADCQRWADCVASAEKVRRAHAADADRYEAQLRDRIAALEAALDRVRAVADRWTRYGSADLARYADILRAALDGSAWPHPGAIIHRTVEYLLQTQQPDGTWEMSSGPNQDRTYAEQRLQRHRERMPDFVHRLVERITTVTVRQLAEQQPAVHTGGDAEDCPACDLDRLPYPWICPGPQS